jgi:hypothetical protein
MCSSGDAPTHSPNHTHAASCSADLLKHCTFFPCLVFDGIPPFLHPRAVVYYCSLPSLSPPRYGRFVNVVSVTPEAPFDVSRLLRWIF